MIEKALLLDGKHFAKQKQIRAKRPSEYWLLFLKRYVLSYKEPWFHIHYLFFLVPIFVLIYSYLAKVDGDSILPIIFFSVIFSVLAFSITKTMAKKAFVPLDAFQELAKFIISIKGDVYRNLISLRLNSRAIETKNNKLDPNKLGLKNGKGIKYQPYQLERFKANLTLNDGSVCVISFHHIALKVTTTKRRSSGKTKTKHKHKHKFFYQLVLKLKESDYTVKSTSALLALSEKSTQFNVSVQAESEFNWIKIKSKKKLYKIESKLNELAKHRDSIYTEMMQYLTENKVMVNRVSSKLIQ